MAPAAGGPPVKLGPCTNGEVKVDGLSPAVPTLLDIAFLGRDVSTNLWKDADTQKVTDIATALYKACLVRASCGPACA
jgi:hypothetical protein